VKKGKRKEKTIPINPLTSTRLKPINDHLTIVFIKLGFRLIPNINAAKINPTPTATPDRHIIGKLDAKYLKPIRTTVVNHMSC